MYVDHLPIYSSKKMLAKIWAQLPNNDPIKKQEGSASVTIVPATVVVPKVIGCIKIDIRTHCKYAQNSQQKSVPDLHGVTVAFLALKKWFF